MMGGTMAWVSSGIGVGIAATVTMDVLGSVTKRLGLTTGPEGRWIGRWFLGIARGQFVHASIAASPERAGEMPVALIAHYAIGIVLAVLYVVGADWLGISPGSLLAALGFGAATCVFPWFLMFPAMGLGVLGLRGPLELRPIRTSLINHLYYGFGLWWAWQVLQLVQAT